MPRPSLVCSLIKQILDDAAADPAALVVDLVSADARLIPRGQTLGPRVLARLEPVVAATAQRAASDAIHAAVPVVPLCAEAGIGPRILRRAFENFPGRHNVALV